VLSIIFKSSTAYNKENEGIAINNNIKQGINVQIISKKVLCCILLGITQIFDIKLEILFFFKEK
jgi:hypothetical protein